VLVLPSNLTVIESLIRVLVNSDPSYSWSGMNQYDHGIYAPSIRKNNGTYYVYYNAYMTGFYYSTAKNLAGPWVTQPLLDMNGKELLTGPAWDDPVSYTSALISETN
jgi:hypothetical protein